MKLSGVERNSWSWITVVALSILASGGLSVLLGQDANWDLKNYHLYNPWALVEGRFETDLLVAGIQSFFNPALDLPYYFLAFEWLPHYPRTVAFLMGLPYGVLVSATAYCGIRLAQDLGLSERDRLTMVLPAVLIGVSGAATISQVGTTFNEVQVAALVLLGLALCMRALPEEPLHSAVCILAAGALFGLAAGLKLTAAVYAPATVLSLLATSGDAKRAVARGVQFCGGWMAAFVLAFGWWGFKVYKLTGNPVFPMFNRIFRSDWAPLASGMDSRFRPESLPETLFYPFYWAKPGPMTVAEPAFSDPRFAICMVAIIGLVCVGMLAALRRSRESSLGGWRSIIPESARFLVVFLVSAYVIWQSMFSILRYAVPIEVLTGLIVMVAAAALGRAMGDLPSSWGGKSLVWLVLSVSLFFTSYPQWGRVKYGPEVLSVGDVAVPDGSLVLVLGAPVAYVVPAIAGKAENLAFVGLTGEALSAKDFGLWKRIASRVAAHDGPIMLLERPESRELRSVLADLGLEIEPSGCQAFDTYIDRSLSLCSIRRR